MEQSSKSGIEKLYKEKEDCVILAITGRYGAGREKAVEILENGRWDYDVVQKSIEKHYEQSPYEGANKHIDEYNEKLERRKYEIINRFMFTEDASKWKDFEVISTRSIAICCLLNHPGISTNDYGFVNEYIEAIKTSDLLDVIKTINSEECNPESKHYDALKTIDGKIKDKAEQADDEEKYLFDLDKQILELQKEIRKKDSLVLAEYIDFIIRAIRSDKEKHWICIDYISNIHESNYLRDRRCSYYLVSVDTANENITKKSDYRKEIGKVETQKVRELGDSFCNNNVNGCIEIADIHINWIEEGKDGFSLPIELQLLKVIALMIHPGLVSPNAVEHVMQIAYNAKLGSGCISRQVGAVVTGSDYSIKAVGWNNPPFDQPPCNLRDIKELVGNRDSWFEKNEFSCYEQEDEQFKQLASIASAKYGAIKGYPCSYCFKGFQNTLEGEKNQVYTRSLHAEENAFLQITKQGGSGVEGGYLFATASPCELCSKKSRQLGIKRVFYINPYPGIARDLIFRFGEKDERPLSCLYSGPIGTAFGRLYDPIMPYKDELELRSEVEVKKLMTPDHIISKLKSLETFGFEEIEETIHKIKIEDWNNDQIWPEHKKEELRRLFETAEDQLSRYLENQKYHKIPEFLGITL